LPAGLNTDPFLGNAEIIEIRQSHLSRLLSAVYKHVTEHEYLFLTSSSINVDYSLDYFNKWVFNGLVATFPYRTEGNIIYKKSSTTEKSYGKWLNEVWSWENNKKRVSRKHVKSQRLNDITAWESDFESCYTEFQLRMAFLAELIFLIHDFVANEGYYNSTSIYGKNMNSIRVFLGQWIVRCYPLKDVVFHSDMWDGDKKSVFEHWTPMSFFRDIIMFTQTRNEAMPLLGMDHFKERILTQKDWFDILMYNYRIVLITKEEYDRLNRQKWKSYRPLNGYDDINVNIKIREKELWEKLFTKQE